jgi:hypothetical protein
VKKAVRVKAELHTLLQVGGLENFSADAHSESFAELESGAWVGKSVPSGGTRSTSVPLTHFGFLSPSPGKHSNTKFVFFIFYWDK